MSAGLSLIQNLAPTAPTAEPLTSVPSSASERMGAAWQGSQTPDRYWNIQKARHERAARIIDDYHAVTGERLANPFDAGPTMEEIRDNIGQPVPAVMAKRLETLRQKTNDLRSTMPDVAELPWDYLNPDSIDSQIGRASTGARDRENNLMDTGNGIPAFIASAGGEMASPHGILSAFLPVSRMPLAAAERTIAGFARNVGREALFQGGVNLAAQIPASVIDYNTRKATGTEQTPEQLVEEFVGAAAGGAMLGGLFRGAHLTVRRLQARGVEIPPAVRDAALVVESRDLYGDKNALGVPAAAHEAAMDRAVADVSRGRSADVVDLFSRQELSPVREALQERAKTPGEPTTSFADALKAERETVWADKELMGRTQEGVGRNEQFVTEIARENVMMREAAADVQDALDNLGLTKEDISAIGKQYQRAADETPAQAFARTADHYVEARERGAIQEDGRFDAEDRAYVSHPDYLMREASPEMQKFHDMLYGHERADPVIDTAAPFIAPEVTEGRPKTGESPQDKAMTAQVKQLLDEGGGATPEHRRQYEAALQQEKETRAALSCIGGGAL